MQVRSLLRLMAGGAAATTAASLLIGIGGATAADDQFVLSAGPVVQNVRAGNEQTFFVFVHTGSASGPAAEGINVQFEVLAGPDVGVKGSEVSTSSGAAIWRYSTAASKPAGGSDDVRAWIDVNGNGVIESEEPVLTTTLSTIEGTNIPPVAGSVEADIPQDVTTNISLGGRDPDGTRVSYSLVTQPEHGTINGPVTGPFVSYTPATGFAGDDTFVYRITDSDGAFADGRVSVHVRGNGNVPSGSTNTCEGKAATLVVDKADQTVFGTAGADVIVANGARAIIYGLAGADTVCVNGGASQVFGGPDNDTIVVAKTGSTVFGGDGDDTISAQTGPNTLFGGNGKDSIKVGDGDSALYGSDGDDVLRGGPGQNTMVGGDGNDRLISASTTSYMWGGNGDDEFTNPSLTWRG